MSLIYFLLTIIIIYFIYKNIENFDDELDDSIENDSDPKEKDEDPKYLKVVKINNEQKCNTDLINLKKMCDYKKKIYGNLCDRDVKKILGYK
jgi:predicted RNA-binding protein with PUA-like domain